MRTMAPRPLLPSSMKPGLGKPLGFAQNIGETLILAVNTVLPSITGDLMQGSTLTLNTGTWTGPVFSFEYEVNQTSPNAEIVARSPIVAGESAASFTGIEGASYTLTVYAMNEDAVQIGVASSTAFGPVEELTDIFGNDLLLLTDFNMPIDESDNATPFHAFGLGGYRKDIDRIGRGAYAGMVSGNTGWNAGMVSQAAPIALGDQDFTIEGFFGGDSEPNDTPIIGCWFGAGTYGYELRWTAANNQLRFFYTLNGTTQDDLARFNCDTDGVSNATVWNGELHHFAVVRRSGVIYVYVDGVEGSGTSAIGTGSIHTPNVNCFMVGASAAFSSPVYRPQGTWIRNLDEIRVTVGSARYTGAFTPPAVAFPRNEDDPSWNQVELLMGMDNPFGFWCASKGTITRKMRNSAGDAFVKDVKGYQGTTGSRGPIFECTDGTFDVGAGDFTIELFGVELTTLATLDTLAAHSYPTDGQRVWRITQTGSGAISFYWSTNGIAETAEDLGMTFSTGVQYDITIERTDGLCRVYVNGGMIKSFALAATFHAPANQPISLTQEGTAASGGTRGCGMFLKAFRFTGAARYSEDDGYLVPALPLPLPAAA